MRRRSAYVRSLLSIGYLAFLLISPTQPVYAEGGAEGIKVKILAINPSETEVLATTVSHALPPEVMPEDVIDRAGMSINYDQDKRHYFLSKEVELKPKEARTIEVRVRDVWVVPDEMMQEIKDEYERGLDALKNTKYYKMGQKLYEKNMEKISLIEESQGKVQGIRQRIELYRANKQQLEAIRNEVLSMSALRNLEHEEQHGFRTAKFVFTAYNPAESEKTLTIRATLPEDITGKDVIDRLNFSLLYDKNTGRYVLESQEVIGGQEKKKYEVILRDVWHIPESELEYYKKQTTKLLEHFAGSQYNDFAVQSVNYVDETISAITELQEEVANTEVIEDRIRAHVLNQQRLELVRRRISDLQDLLLELPVKKSAVDQIRSAVRKLKRVVDIMRLGFTPDLSTTWWIILGIIVFLGMFSTVFYFTWLGKLNRRQWGVQRQRRRVAKKPPPAAKDAEKAA